MELWVVALGAATAGLVSFVERDGECKYAPEVAGAINGTLLATISMDPSVASAATGMLFGWLLAGGARRKADYLALATYVLLFVMLNEYVYLIPATVMGFAAFLDWKLAGKQGILGKRMLTHAAAITLIPIMGWMPIATTLFYDGAYRSAKITYKGLPGKARLS